MQWLSTKSAGGTGLQPKKRSLVRVMFCQSTSRLRFANVSKVAVDQSTVSSIAGRPQPERSLASAVGQNGKKHADPSRIALSPHGRGF